MRQLFSGRCKCAGFVLFFALCTMLFSFNSWAVHTNVGEAASISYVSSSYDGRVVIYAGDSRTMYMTADNLKNERTNCAFAWMNGGNGSCVSKTGRVTPLLKKLITQYRDNCVVVFNFGINGNGNASSNAKNLIKYYRWWMDKYPDVQFFVESVNPSGYKSSGYGNPKIDKLNKKLKKEFDDEYIDVSSYLLKKGIVSKTGKGTRDKLHYKLKTNRAIYKYINKFITKYEEALEEEETETKDKDD